MFLQASNPNRGSLLAGYLNAFQADAGRGLLTVPRVYLHDDIDPSRMTISRESFGEDHAAQIAEEIEEIYGGIHGCLKAARARQAVPSRFLAGAWTLSQYAADMLSMEGSGGRLVEIRSQSSELSLRVGHSSENRMGHDRQVRLSLAISRPEREPLLRTSYDIGFGSSSFHSLLHFLGVSLNTGRLEWMRREPLWAAIRGLLENDGYVINKNRPYRTDQHGLAWQVTDMQGDILEGHLWLEDEYPMIQLGFPKKIAPLPPSFLPLWNGMRDQIRETEKRGLFHPSVSCPTLMRI